MINSRWATNWRINKCSRAYFVKWKWKSKIAVTTFRIALLRRQPVSKSIQSIETQFQFIVVFSFFFSFSSRSNFFILLSSCVSCDSIRIFHSQSMTSRRIQRIFYSTSVRQDSLVDMIQILLCALQFRFVCCFFFFAFSFSPFLRTCVPLAVDGATAAESRMHSLCVWKCRYINIVCSSIHWIILNCYLFCANFQCYSYSFFGVAFFFFFFFFFQNQNREKIKCEK